MTASRWILSACLAVPAAPAGAAVCPADCAGAGPHDALLAEALACAGPGGTIEVSGDCRLQAAFTVNLPDVTLAGTCGARIARILPATAPGPLNPSAAIVLGAGASGATIRSLTVEGAGNGIATSGASAAFPAGQPDKVTIVDSHVVGGLQYPGCAVYHFGQNGPPFNDIDRCTGLEAGLSTGWVVEDNELESHAGCGLEHGGSGFTVRNNLVRATDQGIVARNNARSGAVAPFGAPPSNHDNLYAGNVVEVVSGPGSAPGSIPVGLVDIGFPVGPAGTPSPDRCDRGYGTLWEENCFRVAPDGVAGRDHGVAAQVAGNGNADGSVVVRRNHFEVETAASGTPAGNVGFDTQGSKHILVERNTFAGAGDFMFLSLVGEAEGNLYRKNRFGPGVDDHDGHLIHDFGVPESNCYEKNDYCHSHGDPEGQGVNPACGGNRPHTTCDGMKPAIRCPALPARPQSACSGAASAAAPLRRGAAASGAVQAGAAPAPSGAVW